MSHVIERNWRTILHSSLSLSLIAICFSSATQFTSFYIRVRRSWVARAPHKHTHTHALTQFANISQTINCFSFSFLFFSRQPFALRSMAMMMILLMLLMIKQLHYSTIRPLLSTSAQVSKQQHQLINHHLGCWVFKATLWANSHDSGRHVNRHHRLFKLCACHV